MTSDVKWMKFKEQLRQAERTLLSQLKAACRSINPEQLQQSIITIPPQLALLEDLITKAELLDSPPAKSGVPKFEPY